ncbi:MAG: ABC transporter ATP-binding protein [Gemmatimonadota bacterium]|nr:ABC transporter ATP-binding protein [Gemmatimonadota bacterium]
MADIRLTSVDKVYPGGVHAVRKLDLAIEDGELVVLLGPSGCGKSTVLRLVAGLESLSGGEIHIAGRRVDSDPPDRRDVAMVFQSYALYGHMTVQENLEFPLRMRGVPAAERRSRAVETATLLELTDLLDQRPGALSGGQQQRVAMGRALVRQPAAFLLDEPLSNLDARLRVHVREEIRSIQRKLGVTTLHVTHDQVEALSLGDRIAVLRDGRLQQVGPGQELYDHPRNTFVAAFLGQPGMNLLEGRLAPEPSEPNGEPTAERRSAPAGASPPSETAGSWRVTLTGMEGRLPVPAYPAELGRSATSGPPDSVIVGIRPEDVDVVGAESGLLQGTVETVEELGSERVLHVELPAPTMDATREGGTPARTLFAVRTPRTRTSPGPGERIHLHPRIEKIRVFDAHGTAIDMD